MPSYRDSCVVGEDGGGGGLENKAFWQFAK